MVRYILMIVFLLLSWCSLSGCVPVDNGDLPGRTASPEPGDDDATGGDDDASVGDDDASVGDDDATGGDDDASGGDDDATGGDDDATGGDDDASSPSIDADGDGQSVQGGDCDDSDATVYAGAAEVCELEGAVPKDNDCDGLIDEGVASIYYQDLDQDGYGNSQVSITGCSMPAGYVAVGADCKDSNDLIHPEAPEVCNGIDDNCNTTIDEGAKIRYFQDADGDRYGNPSSSVETCAQPEGYVTNAFDCDDSDAAVSPAASEVCNGHDDNCNGQLDENVTSTFYADSDGDGYGNPSISTQACAAPPGYVKDATDCDDSLAGVHPGGLEACDSLDNDCDGQVDDGVRSTFYLDSDGDGFGTPEVTTQACSAPGGYVASSADCDDTQASIHPGASESCNGLDDNCNGAKDEGLTFLSYYPDTDKDGYGAAGPTSSACSPPGGQVSNNTDCNDAVSAIHPGALEITCNAVDENCTGSSDDHPDGDADSFDACAVGAVGADAKEADCDDTKAAVYPGAVEGIGDGLDSNCNGFSDQVIRVAGRGAGPAGDGGQATLAQLYQPWGVATDDKGAMFIADRNANRIRKVAADGIITTLAGTGVAGDTGDGGAATLAQINDPVGVGVDKSGNVYFAESNGHRVRMISSKGVISTVAGNGTPGYAGDGGLATSASLLGPCGVAADDKGAIFIADRLNHRIRMVSKLGFISTVAGTGTPGYSGDGVAANLAQLYYPSGVAVDATGNVFIADFSNNRVRKVAAGNSVISTVAGNGVFGYGGDGGAATSAYLATPFSVGVDSGGGLYIADFSSARVRKVSGGVISTIAGNGVSGYSGDGGAAVSAMIAYPSGVAVDLSGQVVFAEGLNNRIRRVSAAGIISTAVGSGSPGFEGDGGAATSALFNLPTWVSADTQGNLLVVDHFNHRIRKVAANGVISTLAGSGVCGYGGDGGPATAAKLCYPFSVTTDAQNNVYISDTSNFRVRKVATNGVISTVAGNGNPGYNGDGIAATNAYLYYPRGLAVDAQGTLYLADTSNNRVRKVVAGVISTVAGDGGAGVDGAADDGDGGAATAAHVNLPHGVGLDGAGVLYIVETGGHRVRKVSGGLIQPVVGSGVAGFSGDGGQAASAKLNTPVDVKIDKQGNLFITDLNNQRIRRVSAGGVISTLVGDGLIGPEGENGPASSARLFNAHSIAIDPAGNLVIADTYNHRLLEVLF